MNREAFEDLRRRMVRHGVVNDTAVVVVSAKELEELLSYAEPHVTDPDARCEPGECIPRLCDELADAEYSTCIHCGRSVDMRG